MLRCQINVRPHKSSQMLYQLSYMPLMESWQDLNLRTPFYMGRSWHKDRTKLAEGEGLEPPTVLPATDLKSVSSSSRTPSKTMAPAGTLPVFTLRCVERDLSVPNGGGQGSRTSAGVTQAAAFQAGTLPLCQPSKISHRLLRQTEHERPRTRRTSK